MKVDIEEVSKTKRIFKIEIPSDEVTREFSEAYNDLRKKVKMPGFRPGKAPLSLLERRYGKEVEADLIKRLIPDCYVKALKESGVTPVDMPEIENVYLKKGGPLTFTATVEIKPKIEKVVYESIELKKEDIEVTDKDVDERIQGLRQMYAQFEVSKEEDVIEKGDYVQVDYAGLKDGKPFDGFSKEGVVFHVGAGTVDPRIDEGLVGVRRGEERAIEIPEQNLVINIKVVELKKKVLQEINDDLARDIGGYNSLAELKEKVREDLLQERREAQKANYKKEIIKKLIEWNPVEAPPSLIERDLRRFLERTKRYTGKKGEFESEEEKSLREKYRPYAEEEIKGSLLLMAIGVHEGINATEEDIEEELKEMAQRSKQEVWKVRKTLESIDPALEGLKERIIEDKVIKFIMNNAMWV